jgi:hypothetical protein
MLGRSRASSASSASSWSPYRAYPVIPLRTKLALAPLGILLIVGWGIWTDQVAPVLAHPHTHSARPPAHRHTPAPPPSAPAPALGSAPAPGVLPSAAARADIPPAYLAVYRQAVARWCPRLSWAVLAGVGRVESNHGRSTAPGVVSGVNAAGCCAGPMQFNVVNGPPSTWARYGSGDVYDYRASIPAAARKLCADGAGRPGGLVGAVAAYYGKTVANPPTAAYVAAVLRWAGCYAGGGCR